MRAEIKGDEKLLIDLEEPYLCAAYYCACAIDDLYLLIYAHEQASTCALPA